jgi:hypothetical protein
MRLAWWLCAAAVIVAAPRARADETEPAKMSFRLLVDRVTHEPASIGGTRLQVHLSALDLQGKRLDLTESKAIKTYLGASELKEPYSLGFYGATDAATAIVVVVEATLDYQDVLPAITDSLDTSLFASLDEKQTQIAILPYGETVGTGKLAPLKTARSKLSQITQDSSAGDPALVETVERALGILKKARIEPEGRPLRKMILVIADGRDRAGDRDRVTRLGERAKKEGVRIHSFAFAPSKQYRPLLLLGELSKRSLGTFRWLRSGAADSWTSAFAQINEEVNKQYVVTYYLGADQDPSGKKLKVVTIGRTEATSNELKVPESQCGGAACAGFCVSDRCVVPVEPERRGVLGWLLLIGGIAVGAIVLLGVIGYVITNRSKPIPLPPGVLPPGVVAGGPGSVPPGVIPPPGKAKKSKPGKAPAIVANVPMSRPPGVAPHLMFVTGPRAGERIPLKHGFLIGKAPTCDLVIEDGYTSTHHAQIGIDAYGNCRLYDAGSTNGTFVNGVRVTELPLEHGIGIRIGSTELRFLAQ